jgi:endonuclease/exonuclease/phosphatase family metal-dependent hydrolase
MQLVSSEVLRVVQLNMDSIFGPRWPDRRKEVVTWLDYLNADVVCLQEVWEDHRRPNTAGWIAEHLNGVWHCAFEGFALPDPEAIGSHPSVRFGSAILSRWPIDAVELMALPISRDEDDRPHVTMRVPFVPPGVPYEFLHARTAEIDVYSTHLHSAVGQAAQRVQQVLFIDDAIERTCDPSAALPPVLCGDFNAGPDADEIRFLTGNAVIDGRSTYFQDAWAVLHGSGGVTWDPNNPSVANDYHPRRIDYVFVGDPRYRDGGAGRVVSAELAFNEPRTGVFASDHYGLSVDIAWPTRPA